MSAQGAASSSNERASADRQRSVGRAAIALAKDADKTATNPGKSLIKVLELVGPCLILIDEWVSYTRQLYEKRDLPSGSFDTQFTFRQRLRRRTMRSDWNPPIRFTRTFLIGFTPNGLRWTDSNGREACCG